MAFPATDSCLRPVWEKFQSVAERPSFSTSAQRLSRLRKEIMHTCFGITLGKRCLTVTLGTAFLAACLPVNLLIPFDQVEGEVPIAMQARGDQVFLATQAFPNLAETNGSESQVRLYQISVTGARRIKLLHTWKTDDSTPYGLLAGFAKETTSGVPD